MTPSGRWPRESARGIYLVPVMHDRLEVTAGARSALDSVDPAAVAVELPEALRDGVLKAVGRLPKISVLTTQEPREDALLWVVAPGDPFVEAIRWAVERSRRIVWIDPDIPYRDRRMDPLPDPYALLQLGPEKMFELLRVGTGPGSDLDRRREAGMAYHLLRARDGLDGGAVVALVGAAHVERLEKRLQEPAAHPFARRRRAPVLVRHLAPDSMTGVLADPPLAHAVWEGLRTGNAPESAELGDTWSPKVSVVRFGLRVIAGEGGADEAERRQRRVAYATNHAGVALSGDLRFPDRRRLQEVVFEIGSGSYQLQTDERVAGWQRRLFFDYCGRLARTHGLLAAGLYEWTVAARGVGDDNLAWEVFDAARTYPWQDGPAEIESASIDGDELDLGTRRIRFRKRFRQVKRRPVPVRRRSRPTAEEAVQWLDGFDGDGICSYPPEDVVVEDYGRFLQRRANSVLAAERSRTEPFVSSLLDGVDVRETLRNVHESRIYVREMSRAAAEAGSVVVIFDSDRGETRYPFAMTWLGEHDQESDMAFYSSDPREQVVGPGILRATYGGFLLSSPRGRLLDVWSDPDYRLARDKAEVLVMAAVDYSEERVVVHVGRERPGRRMREYATQRAKRLLHIPLGSLSPVTLKKIRVMHILTGKNKRAVAADYIW